MYVCELCRVLVTGLLIPGNVSVERFTIFSPPVKNNELLLGCCVALSPNTGGAVNPCPHALTVQQPENIKHCAHIAPR